MNRQPLGPLISVVCRLRGDQLPRLKELSKRTRVHQSDYLREAISDLLTKYELRLAEAGRPSLTVTP